MSGGRDAKAKVLMVVASILLMSGSVILGTADVCVCGRGEDGHTDDQPRTPDLANGQTVKMTGVGLSPGIRSGTSSSATAMPSSPTVHDGGVVNSDIPVSCTAPSFSALVTVAPGGTMSGTFKVVQGRNGPPCGPAPSVVTCPATDSLGKSPTADAALYPVPADHGPAGDR